MLGRSVLSVVAGGPTRILGSAAFRLANSISCGRGAGIETGPGGGSGHWLGFTKHRLLGWGWGRRCWGPGLRLLLGSWCGGLRRRLRGCGLRRCRLWRTGTAHRLQLLQSLAIKRRMCRLRNAILVRRGSLWPRLKPPLSIWREIQIGHVFLLIGVWVDYADSMTARPVE